MKRSFFKGCLWLLTLTTAMAAGPFVAPAEGPIPFRRDRLPLDVDTMTGLSHHILLLSKTLGIESAPSRRATAQALALAIALDPNNREAREVLVALAQDKSKSPAVPESAEIESAKSRVWQILSWLESSEACLDAQNLGTCLSDAMVEVDPSHPKSEARRGKGDVGQWTGWVPELASYEERTVAKLPDLKPPEKPMGQGDEGEADILRKTATVSTPLWTYDKEADKAVLRSMQVSMTAWIEGEEKNRHGFNVKFEGIQDSGALPSSDGIITALKSMEDQFPKGGRVSLSLGKGIDYLAPKNRHTISAAAAVLVDSAVSGREPNATVMGLVQDDGTLKMPTRGWDKLRSLSAGQGGRLVLPREAEALLPSILAIEDPGFFMKYEIVLADNLKELVEFSSKGGQGALADASLKFKEIRDKMGSMPVSQYVANRFVRQRLGEIAQACPEHLSARMLFIQGGGERPSRLPRQILASEIRRALEPMTALPADWNDNIDANLIDATHEKCRALLDPLERYVDIRDRDFFGRAKELLTTVRTFGRVKRSSRDLYDNGNSNRAATQQAFEVVKSTYARVRTELAEAANDDEPKDSQKEAPRDRVLPDRLKGSK